MLFVRVFVVVIKKIVSEIERVYRFIACAGCHAPELIAATKFKTTKINFGGLFGLSTKINSHENYPLYGTCFSLDKNFTKPSYLGIAEIFGGNNFANMVKIAISSMQSLIKRKKN